MLEEWVLVIHGGLDFGQHPRGLVHGEGLIGEHYYKRSIYWLCKGGNSGRTQRANGHTPRSYSDGSGIGSVAVL